MKNWSGRAAKVRQGVTFKKNSNCTATAPAAATVGLQLMDWPICISQKKKWHQNQAKNIGRLSTTPRCGSTIVNNAALYQDWQEIIQRLNMWEPTSLYLYWKQWGLEWIKCRGMGDSREWGRRKKETDMRVHTVKPVERWFALTKMNRKKTIDNKC